jgi:hypothetical protein
MTSALVVLLSAISLAVPTGTFRTTITDADLIAGHAGNLAGNRGTYTLKIMAGNSWTMKNTAAGHLINPTQGGTYRAGATSVFFTNQFTGGTFTARLSYRSGLLRFTILRASRPELRVVFGAHPWRRVAP